MYIKPPAIFAHEENYRAAAAASAALIANICPPQHDAEQHFRRAQWKLITPQQDAGAAYNHSFKHPLTHSVEDGVRTASATVKPGKFA